MAEIYLKGAENALILAPREMVVRPFDFGAWTEMRLGFFYSIVTAAGDDTNGVNETVPISSSLDYMAFGIKTNNTVLPRETGTDFLGFMNNTGASSVYVTGSPNMLSSAGVPRAAFITDTTIVSIADDVDEAGSPNASGASGYNGFYGLRFVVTNIGTATQQINIGSGRRTTVSGTDYSDTALRTELLSGGSTGYTMNTARDWNTGAAARVIPSAFYMRMPFFNNRIRMSCMGMIKIA